MSPKIFIRVIVMGIFLAFFALLFQYFSLRSSEKNSNAIAEVRDRGFVGTPKLGGPFTLVDHHGNSRTDADFKGKFMLVYFGYSFCPDICPMALYHISQALEAMGDKAKAFQPLFITIDPERDTVKELARYVENYHPSLVALTGTPENVKSAGKAYKVYAARVQEEDPSSTEYLMDHSSIVYVMDRQGRYLTSFNHLTPPEKIQQILLKVL